MKNRMVKNWILHQMDEDELEDVSRDLDDAETGLSKPNRWGMMMIIIMIMITNVLCGPCGANYSTRRQFWSPCVNKHVHDTDLHYEVFTAFNFRRGQKCFLFHTAH